MRGHHAGNSGRDRGAKGHQLDRGQSSEIVADDRQTQVRVLAAAAVPGKVLPDRQHSLPLQRPDVGDAKLGDHAWIIAEGPFGDDRVVRIVPDVENRGDVQVDSEISQLPTVGLTAETGRHHRLLERQLTEIPTRTEQAHAGADSLHQTAFVVDRHQQRWQPAFASRALQIGRGRRAWSAAVALASRTMPPTRSSSSAGNPPSSPAPSNPTRKGCPTPRRPQRRQ